MMMLQQQQTNQGGAQGNQQAYTQQEINQKNTFTYHLENSDFSKKPNSHPEKTEVKSFQII